MKRKKSVKREEMIDGFLHIDENDDKKYILFLTRKAIGIKKFLFLILCLQIKMSVLNE